MFKDFVFFDTTFTRPFLPCLPIERCWTVSVRGISSFPSSIVLSLITAMRSIILFLVLSLTSASLAEDVQLLRFKEEIHTPPPPPRPYAFGYAAGRFPGHIDRTHSEVSDGAGTVQGSFSYVDPRHQIRTVEYTADKDGFHAFTNEHVPDHPADSPVVAHAKEKHLQKYAAIAEANLLAPQNVPVPADTAAVQHAKDKHFYLYQKIAEEHARMAAELEALKQAEEARQAQKEAEEQAHHQIV